LTGTRFIINALALFVCSLSFTAVAQAQYGNVGDGSNIYVSSAQTFVKPSGSDAGLCSRTSPCKTFDTAMSRTSEGGEVFALESGVYAPVTITKAITLAAPPGVNASIQPTAAIGKSIKVEAGPDDEVVLRNLNFNNPGARGEGLMFGIYFDTGEALRVEGCSFDDMSEGIVTSSPGHLFVGETTILGRGAHAAGMDIGAGIRITTFYNYGDGSKGYVISRGNNTFWKNNVNGNFFNPGTPVTR
jgi:hypothetical protein